MSAMLLKGVIRNGRVEVDQRIDLPEGTEVVVSTDSTVNENDPMTPAEIARIHAAMQRLLPLDISNELAAELDAWEEKINQHGIVNNEKGIEDVFR